MLSEVLSNVSNLSSFIHSINGCMTEVATYQGNFQVKTTNVVQDVK
ncbi:hypothetical protein H9I32_28470 [Bacillus sp. Xin]|nr:MULTISPECIES: hypothetical protein [unclassified Bacillus (in: firmicutes)]MBC6976158.1 hypothetical protein [Bacillus sp. Xin]NSW37340.1 hypothetical protein [Bacillus sp. Xin1]